MGWVPVGGVGFVDVGWVPVGGVGFVDVGFVDVGWVPVGGGVGTCRWWGGYLLVV